MLQLFNRDELYEMYLRPRAYFEKTRDQSALRADLLRYLIVAAAGAFLSFLTAWLNADTLLSANAASRAATPAALSPGIVAFQDAIPWNRLAFIPGVFIFTLVTAVMRHAGVRVLGESGGALDRTLRVTLAGAMIPLCLLIVGGVLTNLAPPIPSPAGYVNAGALWFGLLLFGVGVVWDAWAAVRGLQGMYGQNLGRAITAYFFTYVLGVVSCCLFGFLLFVIRLATGLPPG